MEAVYKTRIGKTRVFGVVVGDFGRGEGLTVAWEDGKVEEVSAVVRGNGTCEYHKLFFVEKKVEEKEAEIEALTAGQGRATSAWFKAVEARKDHTQIALNKMIRRIEGARVTGMPLRERLKRTEMMDWVHDTLVVAECRRVTEGTVTVEDGMGEREKAVYSYDGVIVDIYRVRPIAVFKAWHGEYGHRVKGRLKEEYAEVLK